MELKEIMDDIKNKPTVPIWPHLGAVYGRSRKAIYEDANAGRLDYVIRIGRSFKAITAPLRRQLGIDTAA
jgi:hypothetical protein